MSQSIYFQAGLTFKEVKFTPHVPVPRLAPLNMEHFYLRYVREAFKKKTGHRWEDLCLDMTVTDPPIPYIKVNQLEKLEAARSATPLITFPGLTEPYWALLGLNKP